LFNKTTSFIFNKYGEIVNELTKHQTPKLSRTIVKLKDKSFDNFMFYTSDIYVRVQSGIVMLVVTKDDTARSYERFVVHRHIKIRKGVKFNFLCISSSAKLEVEMDFKAKKRQMSTYDHNPIVYEPIVPTFEIKEILAYYYQVRNASYTFPGEKRISWMNWILFYMRPGSTIPRKPVTQNHVPISPSCLIWKYPIPILSRIVSTMPTVISTTL